MHISAESAVAGHHEKAAELERDPLAQLPSMTGILVLLFASTPMTTSVQLGAC
jgi:hypothetical protein